MGVRPCRCSQANHVGVRAQGKAALALIGLSKKQGQAGAHGEKGGEATPIRAQEARTVAVTSVPCRSLQDKGLFSLMSFEASNASNPVVDCGKLGLQSLHVVAVGRKDTRHAVDSTGVPKTDLLHYCTLHILFSTVHSDAGSSV
jgi:hypothetical protein